MLAVILLAAAQRSVDLFPNQPELGPDYLRIRTWNLRRINLEGDADELLPGETELEDFQSLVATCGQSVLDLGMDILAASRSVKSSSARSRVSLSFDEPEVPSPGLLNSRKKFREKHIRE